jgi:sporulation protein YlmC with PRC-barrel domain
MLNIEDIAGKTVIGALGCYIGEVYNIEIDPVTWQAIHLKVKLSSAAVKKLGLKKRLHRHSMIIPTRLVKEFGVLVHLNQSLDELAKSVEIQID